MDKSEQRDRLKLARKSIDPQHKLEAETQFLTLLQPWLSQDELKSWMVYLSFGSEVPSFPLIQELLSLGREVYAPKILKDHQLGSVRLKHLNELEDHSWGIPEPTGPLMPLDFRADVVVVPGLGFDRRGHRLGYGKGFYDRFLSRRPKVCIGLAFSCQIVDELPVEKHDVPLDLVITPDEVIQI